MMEPICLGNTLVREIYETARNDVIDDLVLQRCNRLFSHPKDRKTKDSSGLNRESTRMAQS